MRDRIKGIMMTKIGFNELKFSLLMIALLAGISFAVSCGDTINGNVVLTASDPVTYTSCTGTYGLLVNGNLDCNGLSITGNVDFAIQLGGHGATVQNCNVRNGSQWAGIGTNDGAGGYVLRNINTSGNGVGIRIGGEGFQNNLLTNINASGNYFNGIQFVSNNGGYGNTLINITASNSIPGYGGSGIYFEYVSGNNLINVTANNNSKAGIWIPGNGRNNNITYSTLIGNQYGIYGTSGYLNNKIYNNNIYNNSIKQIFFFDCPNSGIDVSTMFGGGNYWGHAIAPYFRSDQDTGHESGPERTILPCYYLNDTSAYNCPNQWTGACNCGDNTKNHDETDIDCGGATCGKCAGGKHCTANSDCLSTFCDSGTCRAGAPPECYQIADENSCTGSSCRWISGISSCIFEPEYGSRNRACSVGCGPNMDCCNAWMPYGCTICNDPNTCPVGFCTGRIDCTLITTYDRCVNAIDRPCQWHVTPGYCATAEPPATTCPNGMVSYWTFDDGTAKDTVGTSNGVNNGATPVTGLVGRALSFNGNSNTVSGFNFPSGITFPSGTFSGNKGSFAAWIRFTDVNKYRDDILYGDGANGKGLQSILFPYYYGSLVRFGVYGGPGDDWHYADFANPQSGVWYHLAGTWGSDGVKIYINGSLIATNGYTGGINLNNLILGGYATYGSGATFYGLMDEVAVFNKTLSQAEVTDLYDSTKTGTAGYCEHAGAPPENLIYNSTGGTVEAQGAIVTILAGSLNTNELLVTIVPSNHSFGTVSGLSLVGQPLDIGPQCTDPPLRDNQTACIATNGCQWGASNCTSIPFLKPVTITMPGNCTGNNTLTKQRIAKWIAGSWVTVVSCNPPKNPTGGIYTCTFEGRIATWNNNTCMMTAQTMSFSTYAVIDYSVQYCSTQFISQEGVWAVNYDVTDTYGNRVTGTSDPIKVDLYPPSTLAQLTGVIGGMGWFTSDVVVDFIASDSMSGVKAVYYSLDNATWNEWAGPDTLVLSEYSELYYYAKDRAGHMSDIQSINVHIEKTAPIVSIEESGTSGATPWWISALGLSITATDAESGVKTICYTIGGVEECVQAEQE